MSKATAAAISANLHYLSPPHDYFRLFAEVMLPYHYTRKKKKMILCTVSQKDYYQIKEGILLIDSESFITVTKAYEQKNANKRLRSHIASTQNNTNC